MSRSTAMSPVALAALALMLGTQACTAAIAMVKVSATGRAVATAYDAGAEANAAFEYELARRHYEQAMEEHADAQYRTAIDLAKIGATWAEQAKIVATGGTRQLKGLGEGEDLSDENQTPDGQPKPKQPTGELEDEDFLDDEDK